MGWKGKQKIAALVAVTYVFLFFLQTGMGNSILIFFCTHMVANHRCAEGAPRGMFEKVDEPTPVIDLRAIFDEFLKKTREEMSGYPDILPIPGGFWKVIVPGSEFLLNLKTERGMLEKYRNLRRVDDIGVYEDEYSIHMFVDIDPVDMKMYFEEYVIAGTRFYANGDMSIYFKNFTFGLEIKILPVPECACFVIGTYCDKNQSDTIQFENINLHPVLHREEIMMKSYLLEHFNDVYLNRLNYLYGDVFMRVLQTFDLCNRLKIPHFKDQLPDSPEDMEYTFVK